MATLVRSASAILIASTPELKAHGASWLKKHAEDIRRGSIWNPYWKHNALILREHAPLTPTSLARSLESLHYTRDASLEHQGSFSVKGGIIRIAPVAESRTLICEFGAHALEAIFYTNDRTSLPPPKSRALEIRLRDGDFVVHASHGIGRWRGVREEKGKTFFVLEYAPPMGRDLPDTLLVPESQRERINPYVGFRAPTVHRLGTPLWKATVKKAAYDALAYAKALLSIAAKREQSTRNPYTLDHNAHKSFLHSFHHDYTPSQERAMKDIFNDLSAQTPMDRILVGDVGFGKTEIAMATALQVALSGKQTAVLAPTTVLAEQHAETFRDRLKDFPITIAKLSRLSSNKEEKSAIKGIAQGSVDIVIGTHRILSKDVVFKNLGLLILDEEQRFGVTAKEKLKSSSPDLDMLTLTATPLPRTLTFALSSLRAMSTLTDPPIGRKAPETLVVPFNWELVALAIAHERNRKGQTYVLANRIHRIPALIEKLKEHAPHARVGILHGRLTETGIAEVMDRFRHHKLDILVSTTIIENGIHLENANTLIVEDATLLGLAESHQLRGRIGRGTRSAHAYFCYPKRYGAMLSGEIPRERTASKALNRLEALADTQYLGAGEEISRMDMELRGAGNMLGKEQSGTAHRVGLNLYCELLEQAVKSLK